VTERTLSVPTYIAFRFLKAGDFMWITRKGGKRALYIALTVLTYSGRGAYTHALFVGVEDDSKVLAFGWHNAAEFGITSMERASERDSAAAREIRTARAEAHAEKARRRRVHGAGVKPRPTASKSESASASKTRAKAAVKVASKNKAKAAVKVASKNKAKAKGESGSASKPAGAAGIAKDARKRIASAAARA
jgi:hypothetical protein